MSSLKKSRRPFLKRNPQKYTLKIVTTKLKANNF